MYIQVRKMDGSSNTTVTTSKSTKIAELKTKVAELLDAPVDKQRLFFRGKQLEDEYTLFDYNINLNDVVQLMVKQDIVVPPPKPRPLLPPSPEFTLESTSTLRCVSMATLRYITELNQQNNTVEDNSDHNSDQGEQNESAAIDDHVATEIETPEQPPDEKITQDDYFKVGDIVDCKASCGGWFEAEIKEIIINNSPTNENKYNSYKVVFINSDEPDTELQFKYIRPRANVLIPFHELKKGQVILANYNAEGEGVGFWYTCHVEKVSASKIPKLIVAVELGREDVSKLHNCSIKHMTRIFKLEEPKLITERTSSDEQISQGAVIPMRDLGSIFCELCNDAPVATCSQCGCKKCLKKKDPDRTILCDECDDAYHLYCLDPPLQEVPSDDWYCVLCKNDDSEIVKAGEKLKFSKKKSQMASTQNKTKDWGRGMACVGRTSICTIVPLNHFGPVPGVEVGTSWKYRLQVSEAGIHRPHVSGIHGRESEGAYSIVLSGGYEGDEDNGETFLYSGSGGRDLSGNKRTAGQSGDQKLTLNNLALAKNCNAPVNNKKGATAEDWRSGKPVRVVRNYKLHKHSKYAPEIGNRYDGIYKVVKYFPDKGESGFLIWRYLLRRDDPTPAPWTPEGKKLIASLGLDTMMNPAGYKDDEKTGKKRSHGEDSPGPSGIETPPKKKIKVVAYKLPSPLKKLINKDTSNEKIWKSILTKLDLGKQEFLSEVQNSFVCSCCLELVSKPVTTDCKHNFCKSCLMRSIKAEVYTCAHCRHDLGRRYKPVVNDELQAILSEIFPGYNKRR